MTSSPAWTPQPAFTTVTTDTRIRLPGQRTWIRATQSQADQAPACPGVQMATYRTAQVPLNGTRLPAEPLSGAPAQNRTLGGPVAPQTVAGYMAETSAA